MENITKLKIFLSSCLFICLVSCNSHRYDITWHSFGISTNNYIKLYFLDNLTHREYTYKLIPNKTKYINVPNGTEFYSEEMPMEIRFAVYPNPKKLPNGGELEFFVFNFNPTVERINENEFKMKRQEGVEAYFVKFSKNGKRYSAISKDEIISTQKEISEESFDNILQLLDLILVEDIIYYNEFATKNYYGPERVWGGYIVKTKTDGKYLWLDSF